MRRSFLAALVSAGFAGGCHPTAVKAPNPEAAPLSTADRLRAEAPVFTGTERERKLKETLYWGFSSTTWYPHIRDVKIGTDVVTVTSDLRRGDRTLKGICSGMSGQIFANGSDLPKRLQVVDEWGGQLLVRNSISEPCELK